MASIQNLLLRITGENNDAKQALAEVAVRVKALAAQDASVHLKVGGAKRAREEIASLEKALTIIGKRNVTAKVKVKLDKQKDVLGSLRKELDHALGGGVGARPIEHILKDIAKAGANVAKIGARVGAGFAGLFKSGVTIGEKFSGILGSLGEGAIKFGSSLASGLVAAIPQMLLLVAAAVLLLPIFTALLAVVLALVAALLAAAAGFAVLLVSGIGLLIPALAVFLGLITRVIGAFQALGKQQQQAKQNARQLKAAEDAHSAAIRSAADARKNLARATVDAYTAERDAALALKDATLALEEAKLGEQDANLRLEQAKLNLKGLKDEAKQAGSAFSRLFDQVNDTAKLGPSGLAALERKIGGLPGKDQNQLDVKGALLEVLHAQLGIKEAKNQTEHATNNLADAQKRENEFARQGIRAYEPYVAALKQVAAADREVAKTARNTQYIRERQNAALKKYSKQELDLARSLKGLFHEIKKVFETIAKPALAGLQKLIGAIKDLLADPGIQAALKQIGGAFGYVFEQFAKLLQTREIKDLFASLARHAARFVRVLGGNVLPNIFELFLKIADYAAPAFLDLLKRFGDFIGRLVHGKDAAKNLHHFVKVTVDAFKNLLRLGRAVARVIINFVKDANGPGQRLLKTFTKFANRLADTLADPGKKAAFIDWLNQGLDRAGKIASAFGDFLKIANELLGPLGKMVELVTTIAEKAGTFIFGGDDVADHKKTGNYSGDELKTIGKDKAIIRAAIKSGDIKRANALRRQFDADFPNAGFLQPDLAGPRQDSALKIAQRAIDIVVGTSGKNSIVARNIYRKYKAQGLAVHLAEGGIVSRFTNAVVGESGPEAVIPLKDIVLAGIGRGIVEATRRSAGSSSRSLARGIGGGREFTQHNNITLPPPPANHTMDARSAAVMLARELERRGGGTLAR